MQKDPDQWPVRELRKQFFSINFPEYQREPSLWSRREKQLLIDSMLRRFDIASLYFYRDTDESLYCIDGRQRIGAIMAFLGENNEGGDAGFELTIQNEVYKEESHPFQCLDGKTFEQICEIGDSEEDSPEKESAARARDRILDYEITVILLSEADPAEEFNLQFTRLNLGKILNAGEKLHAMVGAMREICFTDERIGGHPLLQAVGIPGRRYAKEQLAATILAQVFSKKTKGQYRRTRHFDLQGFFKTYTDLGDEEEGWIEEVRRTLDWLQDNLPDANKLLRNRAMTVSVVLLALEKNLAQGAPGAEEFEEFLSQFLGRLRWQVGKGLDVDDEYRYLIDFQKHVTQASVEKPAVKARAARLGTEMEGWRRDHRLTGDDIYEKKTGDDPLQYFLG